LVEAEGKRDAPAAADTAAPPAAPTDAAPTGERPVIVQVRNVVVRYGEATILDGVSFDIREGEIFAILGGSGCGKSTLLRQLIGLERPAAGNVLIDGDSATVIKDLKIKGSSSVVKVGTKIRNIRIVAGDHDIDCKIDGIGAMQLKSEFIKKA